MQNSLQLEGFDAPVECARILPFDAGEDAFVNNAPELVPEPATAPELDIETLPAEENDNAEAEALQSLATTLAAITRHVDSLHAGLSDELSVAIGDAVLKSLPSVIEEGFAAEIAEVTRSILNRLSQTCIRLRIAPVHHEHIVEAFDGLAPSVPIEIVDDDTLNPGQARLEWASGGAEFDAEDWTEAARVALKRHLEHLSTRRRDDD